MKGVPWCLLLFSTLFTRLCFADTALDNEVILQLKQRAALLAETIKQHPPQIETKLPSIYPEDVQRAASLEFSATENMAAELAAHFHSAHTNNE